MQPRCLGVIPARAGSKRIPNKNLRSLAGKPLIAWTIEAAERSSALTTFVVSTECANIAQVANLYGAYVVKRPDELAADDTTSGAVCVHALNWMGADDYDLVCLLHPTSPIRGGGDIDNAIDLLWNSDAPALASVECIKRCYVHNANIYVMRTAWLLANPNKHYCEESIPFLQSKQCSIDINTEEEWQLAEILASTGAEQNPSRLIPTHCAQAPAWPTEAHLATGI